MFVQSVVPSIAVASVSLQKQPGPIRGVAVPSRRSVGASLRIGARGRPLFSTLDGLTSECAEVTVIDSVEQFDSIIGSSGEKLVILNAGASWCGPCKLFKPTYDDLARQYTSSNGAVFLYCVGDKNPSTTVLMKRLNIKSVPSFHLFKNGEQLTAFSGANKQNFTDKIEKFL